MSASGPVLVSIKGGWNSVVSEPVVGKDVLELLSSSMYVNALSIYREYVQNSADAIEEAAATGLLDRGKGRVDISVDPVKRNVRVRDNGTGVGKVDFVQTLIDLGASRKRGSKARGFRGVGRLAGLGYCQELIFRSRAEGDKEVSELIWDCRRLRTALRDSSFVGTAEELIKNVVKVRSFVSGELPTRFFEVELATVVRHGDDSLVNEAKIHDYLSQVAPVPFDPEFRFAKSIQEHLRALGIGSIFIYLNGEGKPVYRPFQNSFEARKGASDEFTDLKVFNLKGDGEDLLATIWLLHHGYRGAIDNNALIKGLRLRLGNIQVGECDILEPLFAEPRFNSWCVGEVHVLDPRILPNGRRDHLEQSVHFNDLLNRLSPLGKKLSRLCRRHSVRRNALRQFQITRERLNQNMAVVSQGAIGSAERKRLSEEMLKQVRRLQKLCEQQALDTTDKDKLGGTVNRVKAKVDKVLFQNTRHPAFARLNAGERRAFERFVSLAYECSSNKSSTKLLIDRILTRI